MAGPSIAVVGATGAVGREVLAVLEERGFPHGELRLLASERSAGVRLPYRGSTVEVTPLRDGALRGMALALFSAGASVSRAHAPLAARDGCVVVDNSSAFRMDPGVPLVVPEANAEALAGVALGRGGIVANPNCSAIIMIVALTPLRRAFGVRRVVVSTYQAASGAGAQAMAELEAQTRAALAGERRPHAVFHEPYAFNLFSHNAGVDPRTGRNGEEEKMIAETRRIWNDPAVGIAPTCVRVPVMRAHAEAIGVELERPATVEQVRSVLADAPGVRLVDDRAANSFPTPLKAAGTDDVLVGRVRVDPSLAPAGADADLDRTPARGFQFFACGDQLRKGAALNAVQIAEIVANAGR